MSDGTLGWFSETIHKSFEQRFEISEVLYRSRTKHQDLVIFETPFFGRVLALDNVIQTTQRDEAAYHEMITHVPILAHGGVRDVLIIGGGDGGALRDTLKHRSVEHATIVEIDGGVVELCREFLPSLNDGAFDDPRAELIIADGLQYVKESERRFDLIIIDSTDPIGPSVPLFSDEFYVDCRNVLSSDGIFICQSGVSFVQEREARETHKRLSDIFEDSALYVTLVPTYAFGFMTLGWGARSHMARSTDIDTVRERFDHAGINTHYYTPDLHAACFSLPRYMNY
ncbi:MAG: polyamine aminopropyltransferase [Pseudomonadota bacterium]|nr:polyamine aminopropyltransferase [Pseudomonadota bacterium]